MADKLGIYIHIPFCRSKCDYCDFYSLAGREDQMDRYQKALLAHLKETAPLAQGYPVDSIYFGGGTPSYYGAKRIKELLAHLSKLFQVEKDAEITVECNPDSVDLKSLRILRKAGVNRLSMGMQSAQEAELRAIHRIHTPQQTNQAVEAARKAKFTNLSLDLIYGLPGQTMESWKATVEHALSLIPQHLSCYGLKVEEGTRLWEYKDCANLPDDDAQADMYFYAVETLESFGYQQYEISNFAKPGRECRHNLKYWMGDPYLGFGPAASSDFAGKRFTAAANLDQYITGILEQKTILSECESIPLRERAGEYLMLRLRTSYGIEENEYMQTYLLPFAPLEKLLTTYAQRDLAKKEENGRWRLTPKGFMVSNAILVELLEVQQKSNPLARIR